ncbi:MAG: HD domain-containing protein [Desulfobacterium sp.]|nr:HD domain-containing protein [Desulfobacterium sp.]
MTGKRIRDPLYGFIRVDGLDLKIIDHKLVQRLRWISQLPLEQLVYPSAQHSRFEHSLGVMHLAEIAADRLIQNSKERFDEAVDAHSSPLRKDFKKEEDLHNFFVRCAKWSGLLHDLGHAPFSHTLEDACRYSVNAPVKYDHENFGYFLARKIFEDLKDVGLDKGLMGIVLRVLNKNIQLSDLYPLEILIRRIIDGPMDVDKGDYLPRDSYHCGVNYGVYDHTFLWDNVVITQSFQLGVLPKAALEAWGLTLARHKMFNYVYKHHVRTITDALLVEILQLSFDAPGMNHNDLRDIVPLQAPADVDVGQNLHKFVHWTDNSLLKALDSLGNSEISSRIEAFSSRNLYKKSFAVNLSAYPNAVGNESDVLQRINILKNQTASQGMAWNAIPLNEIIVPVFDRKVQRELLVQEDSGQEIPVAEYLGFGVDEDQIQEQGDMFLHVFVKPFSSFSCDDLKNRVADLLKDFEV